MTADIWFTLWVLGLGMALAWIIGEFGRIRQERQP